MKTRTTPEQRAELERLESGRDVSPAPWAVHPLAKGAVHQPRYQFWIPQSGSRDADLIAAARNILPDLLADLEDALAEVSRLKKSNKDHTP